MPNTTAKHFRRLPRWRPFSRASNLRPRGAGVALHFLGPGAGEHLY